MATRDEINTILKLLSTLPNCPITNESTRDLVRDMYFAALGDTPIVWLQAAYLQYIGGNNPFFPSNPGTLQEIAFDLEITAQGVPTAAQAWAMVLRGPAIIEGHLCPTGKLLQEKAHQAHETTRSYFRDVEAYADHEKNCDICQPTSRTGSYGSTVVDEIVRLMGGRDVIFTDNMTSDRARFLDSYRELVSQERRHLQMHPKVKALVNDPNRPSLAAGGAITSLAARLSAGSGK